MNELKNLSITIDDSIKMEAWGFDKKDNAIEKLNAAWNSDGSLDQISLNSESFEFKPKTPNTEGVFNIAYQDFSGKSGKIKVFPGGVASLKIVELKTKNPLEAKELKVGDKLKLVAVGYDREGNYLKPIEVAWEVTGDLNNLAYSICKTNEFVAHEGEKSGTIKISHEKAGVFESGLITVLKPVTIVKKLESDNSVIYYVYNADVLSKIISRVLSLRKPYRIIDGFVQSISKYNKLRNPDLIFPKQEIKFPAVIATENDTLNSLALKYFGDEKRTDLLKIYNSGMDRELKPGEKVLLKDTGFLATGIIETRSEEFKRPEAKEEISPVLPISSSSNTGLLNNPLSNSVDSSNISNIDTTTNLSPTNSTDIPMNNEEIMTNSANDTNQAGGN